jgi:AraC-like DNA-binding protein
MEDKQELEAVIFKLNVAMDFNLLYKDPNLNLTKLAAHLDLHYGVLSKVIKTYYGLGFRAYLNQLRIDKLVSTLDKTKVRITIEESMKLSGFRSRVTFFNAFKSRVGMNFSAYFASKLIPKEKELPIFYVVDEESKS